jgi:hypothetical protein
MLDLYSGVAIRIASAARIALLNAATAGFGFFSSS